ncbi:hypothetical protein AB0M43_01810 [Longispora sp. NPDC051575]|uniref:hypothetical protein n=1 Tax=Longispora sp. NPDC051575 TaxID=3154943 RepID=UPI003420FC79
MRSRTLFALLAALVVGAGAASPALADPAPESGRSRNTAPTRPWDAARALASDADGTRPRAANAAAPPGCRPSSRPR